jgi:hypothetical protein
MVFDLHKKCQKITMRENKSDPMSGKGKRETCALQQSSDLFHAAQSFLRM